MTLEIQQRPAAEYLSVELRESGGIANLAREFVLQGQRFTVMDKGELKAERTLAHAELEPVLRLVERLVSEISPKRYYGRTLVSDPIRLELSAKLHSHGTTVEVLTDPTDPPPDEVMALVKYLRQLVTGPSGRQKVV